MLFLVRVLCVARILCIVLTALASIAFTHYLSKLP